MAGNRRKRLYTRRQGQEDRFYADFRDFADVGGRREALIPAGARRATNDEKLALGLLAGRLADLEMRRRRRQREEPVQETYLGEFAKYHLLQKRLAGRCTAAWLEAATNHLRLAEEFFGGERPPSGQSAVEAVRLDEIGVREVQDFTRWLAGRSNGRGGALSPSSQRKCLNSLSNLFRRALSEECLSPAFNPVSALLDKPQDRPLRAEAAWLEVPKAATLLEAARCFIPRKEHAALRPGTIGAIIGTMLLSGGRPSEVLGLEAQDISFERRTVTFRPNATRRSLKTGGSHRVIPLWPQLGEILADFLACRPRVVPTEPLFPSHKGLGRVIDIRKTLDAITEALGWGRRAVRPYAFRHTYCTARLQTLDRGAPISPFTVARELGHGGLSLVNRVYGHLGEVRHRSEEVEYRVSRRSDVFDPVRALKLLA